MKYFGREKEKLCKDCQWRLENVLRIFDCKIPSCQPVIEKAPWEEFAPLSAVSGSDQKLAEREIACTVNRRLVRGWIIITVLFLKSRRVDWARKTRWRAVDGTIVFIRILAARRLLARI